MATSWLLYCWTWMDVIRPFIGELAHLRSQSIEESLVKSDGQTTMKWVSSGRRRGGRHIGRTGHDGCHFPLLHATATLTLPTHPGPPSPATELRCIGPDSACSFCDLN